jgi:D-lyxose ketol-isomerase
VESHADQKPPFPAAKGGTMIFSRSLINRCVETAREVFARSGMRLPEFALWTPEQWMRSGHEADEVRDCMLGWDVTDFGVGDFTNFGRCLFTLRNGRHDDPRYPKTYAEKFILDPEGQRAPMHFHRRKREDIINRGTGIIMIELTSSTPEGLPDTRDLAVTIDGVARRIRSGARVALRPGQSICIHPGMIHQFWGEGGDGILIDGILYGASGEVSSVCDDVNDNVFLHGDSIRFPRIEEDEARRCYLCSEYPRP